MTISWWQWLPYQPWRIVGAVDSADDIPSRLPRNGAVIVGDNRFAKWIAFDCPCRTGHRIMLNTDAGRRPAWRIAPTRNSRLTISPSVDYSGEHRRCHYFVRDGRIEWAKDSTR